MADDSNVIDFEQGRRRLREQEALAAEADAPAEGADGATLIYDPKPGTVAVELTQTPDHVAYFRVSAPADLTDEAIAHARASLARRKDADPDDALALEHLRMDMGAEAFDLFVAAYVQQALFAKAVLRTGVIPFAQPDLTDETLPQPGAGYAFTTHVLVRPQVELTSYEPVSVVFPERHEVDEGQVDAYLAHVSEQLGSMSQEGMEGLPAGVDPTRIDEAWVRAFMPEAGGLAGLRAQVRGMLEQEEQRAYEDELGKRCADELAKRLPPDVIGDAYLERACEDVHANRVEDLAAQGVDFLEVSRSKQFDELAWRRSVEQEARETLGRAFALDALADHLDIQIDREDVLEVLESVGSGHESADVLQDVIDAGQMPHVCEIALRRRANRWLAEHARPKSTAHLHLV